MDTKNTTRTTRTKRTYTSIITKPANVRALDTGTLDTNSRHADTEWHLGVQQMKLGNPQGSMAEYREHNVSENWLGATPRNGRREAIRSTDYKLPIRMRWMRWRRQHSVLVDVVSLGVWLVVVGTLVTKVFGN